MWVSAPRNPWVQVCCATSGTGGMNQGLDAIGIQFNQPPRALCFVQVHAAGPLFSAQPADNQDDNANSQQ